MGDVAAWFQSLPPLTRFWFGGTVAVSLIGRFGFISPFWFQLYSEPLFYGFEIWRVVTCLLYYRMGMRLLFNLYFIYKCSVRLENEDFAGKPADYLFMLLFMWVCSIIVALIGHITMIMDIMVMCILYVWCQLYKDTIVSFWFGITFKAMYLPWVILGFAFVVFGGGVDELLGIIIGHLYYFLTIKYPEDFGGPSLIYTPEILYKFLPNQQVTSGFGQAPTPRRAGDGGGGGGGGGGRGIFRGQGHTLG